MIKKWLEHKYLNIEVQFIFPLLFTYLYLSIVKYYLKKRPHTYRKKKRKRNLRNNKFQKQKYVRSI